MIEALFISELWGEKFGNANMNAELFGSFIEVL